MQGCALTFQAVVRITPVVLQQGVAPLRGEILPVPQPVGPSMIFHHVEFLAGLGHPGSRPTWGSKMGG